MEEKHLPWLVKDGDSAWYASTVPVGRSCARFAALDMTLSVAMAAAGTVVGTSPSSLGVAGAVGWPLVFGLGGIWITAEDGEDDAMVWSIRDILSRSEERRVGKECSW